MIPELKICSICGKYWIFGAACKTCNRPVLRNDDGIPRPNSPEAIATKELMERLLKESQEKKKLFLKN